MLPPRKHGLGNSFSHCNILCRDSKCYYRPKLPFKGWTNSISAWMLSPDFNTPQESSATKPLQVLPLSTGSNKARQRPRARLRAESPAAAFGTATATTPRCPTPDPRFVDCGAASVPRDLPLHCITRRGRGGAEYLGSERGIPDPVRLVLLTTYPPAPFSPPPPLVSGENRGSDKRHGRVWTKARGGSGKSTRAAFSRDVWPNSSPFFPHPRNYHRVIQAQLHNGLHIALVGPAGPHRRVFPPPDFS